MSYRSQDKYRSALTSRFTRSKPRVSEDTTPQPFIYRPLRPAISRIRLAHLFPRRCWPSIGGTQIVACELLEFSVDRAPPYVALSYVWGDSALRKPIFVGTKQLQVTENLESALNHFAEDDKTVIIWVDALCINQSDDVEKGVQVNRMGGIYRSAAAVLVWLGPAADESDLALQKLRPFMNSPDHSTKFMKASDAEIAGIFSFEGVIKLFQRPWFTRVWVRQEVVMNRHVYFVCGNQSLSPLALMKAYECFASASSRLESGHMPLYFFRFVRDPGVPGIGPWPLKAYLASKATWCAFLYGRHLQSSEPRDFVYSQLGMIEDHTRFLTIDYTDPVEKVYTDFAEALLWHGSYEFLRAGWGGSLRYPALPSWVPDWSSPAYFRPTKCNISNLFRSYVHGGTKMQAPVTGERILQVWPARLGAVTEIVFDTNEPTHFTTTSTFSKQDAKAPFSTREDVDLFVGILGRTIATAVSADPDKQDGSDVNDKVFELSTSFTQYPMKLGMRPDGVRKSYHAFINNTERNLNTNKDTEPQAASIFYLNALRSFPPKQIFRTEFNSLVGISDGRVEPGDVVFIFPVSAEECHLWALRKVGGMQDYYRVMSNLRLLDFSKVAEGLRCEKINLC